MIFIYKMASGVRMSKNWIPRLRFLFLSFSQYVADYSDPRSRPFLESITHVSQGQTWIK